METQQEPESYNDMDMTDIQPQSPEERIQAIRAIVDSQQFATIDGAVIDLYSASLIVQIYDNLNPINQAKFASYKAPQMGIIAYQLISKQS